MMLGPKKRFIENACGNKASLKKRRFQNKIELGPKNESDRRKQKAACGNRAGFKKTKFLGRKNKLDPTTDFIETNTTAAIGQAEQFN